MAWAVITGAVSGISTTFLIALINAWIGGERRTSHGLVWGFAGLCLLRLLSGVASHVLLVRLSQGMIRDLRTGLCNRILAAPLEHLERLGSHRLIAAFSDDTLQIAQVVINVPYLLVNVVILCGSLLYLGWLSGPMLLGVALCLAAGAASYLLPVIYANRALRTARRHQDGLFGEFRAMLEGLKELKLHAVRRQQFAAGQLHPAAEAVRRHNVWGITVYSIAANWNRLLFFVYVGLLLFAWPELRGTGPGALAGYIVVVLYMMAPIEAVINVLPHLAQADVAMHHIEALHADLRQATTEPCTRDRELATQVWRQIQLAGVTHRYAEEQSSAFVLGPIDLVFRPGELTFVMGGNGSGKTTLAKVLTGLYAPTRGQILVDSQVVTAANREQYRQLFSTVYSDFHVFPQLVDDGSRSTEATVRSYLRQFQLDAKLSIAAGRFSTTALSQGQRKRLALIVAIAEDRPVYVLDEWAADQDPEFREIFYRRILPQLKAMGKCIVVITHDDRYHMIADCIVRLEDGRVESVTCRDPQERADPLEGSAPAVAEPSRDPASIEVTT